MDDTATKHARLEAQIDSEQHALIQRAAEIEGRTLSDFVVDAALVAARDTVGRADVIRVGKEGSEFVARLLVDETSGPNEAMQRAFERRRVLFGVE